MMTGTLASVTGKEFLENSQPLRCKMDFTVINTVLTEMGFLRSRTRMTQLQIASRLIHIQHLSSLREGSTSAGYTPSCGCLLHKHCQSCA